MVALGPFAQEPPTLRAVWTMKGNSRQHSAAGLVARYGLPPSDVRELLADYLTEVRPGLDYGTWSHLGYTLAFVFWRTVLDINPDQADLRLAPEVAAAWRGRLALTREGRPRREAYGLRFSVRAFYRDINDWALEDPARWSRWAAPSPVRESDLRGTGKAKRQRQARIQQRTRILTPLVPALVATALARRDWAPASSLPPPPGTANTSTSTTSATPAMTRLRSETPAAARGPPAPRGHGST